MYSWETTGAENWEHNLLQQCIDSIKHLNTFFVVYSFIDQATLLQVSPK